MLENKAIAKRFSVQRRIFLQPISPSECQQPLANWLGNTQVPYWLTVAQVQQGLCDQGFMIYEHVFLL